MLNTVKAWPKVEGEVPCGGGNFSARLLTIPLSNHAENIACADFHVHVESPAAFQFMHAAAGSPLCTYYNGNWTFKVPSVNLFNIILHCTPEEEAPAA